MAVHLPTFGSQCEELCENYKNQDPDLPFLAVLEEARKPTQKSKDFLSLYAEHLNSLEKKGKMLKKQGNSLQRKKQGNPKKQGKEDQGKAPVRFGSVTVSGWNGSSGSGFGSGSSSAKRGFCVAVQFNMKGRFRFRFRFLENGSGGSGSALGFGKKRFRRFRFPVPVRFLSHPEKSKVTC